MRLGTHTHTHRMQGHLLSVANVALHPTKPILVTASDDKTWKMWHMPAGDLIMCGEGHKVSGVCARREGVQGLGTPVLDMTQAQCDDECKFNFKLALMNSNWNPRKTEWRAWASTPQALRSPRVVAMESL